MLVENYYIDSINADHLNRVWIYPMLENAISNNDVAVLPAFDVFT